MQCSKCGHEMPMDYKYCRHCGELLQQGRFCTACGTAIPPEGKFCPSCGLPAASQQQQQLPTYTPQITPPSPKKNQTARAVILAAFLVVAVLLILIVALLASRYEADSAEERPSVSEVIAANRPDLAAETPDTESTPLAKAAGSVLYLEIYDDDGDYLGCASGFLVNDDTTLVTNYHVIEDAAYLGVFRDDSNSGVYAETVIACDEDADLAILQCEEPPGVSPLILADSDLAIQGDTVYAAGYPLGIANTLSNGIISSRYIDEYGVDIVQHTAPISEGSSGGALLNEDGEVIGVTCAYYVDGQNMNLAIASNVVAELLDLETEAISMQDTNHECSHEYGPWETTLAATCTTEGEKTCVCTLCGEAMTKPISTVDHTMSVTETVAATCTEDGTQTSRCSICEEETITTIPAAGHQAVTVPAVPASCTGEGTAEGSRCEICGTILSGCVPLPAAGHNYQNYVCSKCGVDDPNKPAIVSDPLQGTWEAYYLGSDGVSLERVDVFFFSNGQFQFLQDMPFEENDKAHGGTYTFDGTTITFYVTTGDAPSSSYTMTLSSFGTMAGGSFFETSSGQYFWKV